jgi:hypothetical protein
MNSFRAALVLIFVGVLAACDNSPPPAPEPPPAPTVEVQPTQPSAQPATQPAAPLPTAPQPVEVAVVPPVPRPSNERPLSADAQAELAPLFGTWATDLRNCESGAIRISRSRFEGAENGCDIDTIVDTGGWNFVATLVCTSQGQSVRERVGMIPLFAPTGEGIGLTYLDRDNQQVTVLRCD